MNLLTLCAVLFLFRVKSAEDSDSKRANLFSRLKTRIMTSSVDYGSRAGDHGGGSREKSSVRPSTRAPSRNSRRTTRINNAEIGYFTRRLTDRTRKKNITTSTSDRTSPASTRAELVGDMSRVTDLSHTVC